MSDHPGVTDHPVPHPEQRRQEPNRGIRAQTRRGTVTTDQRWSRDQRIGYDRIGYDPGSPPEHVEVGVSWQTGQLLCGTS